MLIAVTHTEEIFTRNWHQMEHSSNRCRFLIAETVKHSRPIKLTILVSCISPSVWFLKHVSPLCVSWQ